MQAWTNCLLWQILSARQIVPDWLDLLAWWPGWVLALGKTKPMEKWTMASQLVVPCMDVDVDVLEN